MTIRTQVMDIVVYTKTEVNIPANDHLSPSGAVVKTFMASYLGKVMLSSQLLYQPRP